MVNLKRCRLEGDGKRVELRRSVEMTGGGGGSKPNHQGMGNGRIEE